MTVTTTPAEFMSASPAPLNGSSPWASLTLPSGHVTVFDEADRTLVEQFKWHVLKARHGFYVQTKGAPANGGRRTYLHRLLLGEPVGRMVDHINLDGLDNRRSNLRVATSRQNNANAPGWVRYRGVHHHPNNKSKPWRARIGTRGSDDYQHLGYFATEWEAAEAFNIAAVRLWGEFALLNVRQP